ncbi:MAG: hypothetical protein IIA67_08160, partial [Planctomycetes bacterium]|nr:hypothetical protein [Planctomycetota bacterium]
PFPVINRERIDPYLLNDGDGPLGRQRDKNDDGKHWFDNIHNHELRAELQ